MKLASLRLKQRNTKLSRVYNLNLQIRLENVLDHSFKKKLFFLKIPSVRVYKNLAKLFFTDFNFFIFTTNISIPSKHLHQSLRHSIWPSISNPCFSYDYLRNFTCVFKSLLQLIKCLLYNPLISKTTNSLETK